jgi:FkbM family methyltransferase
VLSVACVEYPVRRLLRVPRASVLRRVEPDAPERAFLERFSYSRAIYAFLRARAVNPYLTVDFGLDERSVVIDAGAYVGAWTAALTQRRGSSVHAFEPNPKAFARLHARVTELPNVQAYEFGLGARDEKQTLTLQGPGSTVYGTSSTHDSAIVEIRDIAAVLDELGIGHVDLLKLNIEGGEYDVLQRLIDTGWSERISVILVQFHEWIPHAHRRRRALRRALRQTHSQLWQYPWIWEAWHRPLPPGTYGQRSARG